MPWPNSKHILTRHGSSNWDLDAVQDLEHKQAILAYRAAKYWNQHCNALIVYVKWLEAHKHLKVCGTYHGQPKRYNKVADGDADEAAPDPVEFAFYKDKYWTLNKKDWTCQEWDNHKLPKEPSQRSKSRKMNEQRLSTVYNNYGSAMKWKATYLADFEEKKDEIANFKAGFANQANPVPVPAPSDLQR